MDLMFPHHENELAQSESCTNQPFVKYWLHNGLTKLRTKAAGGQWQATDIHESTGNAAMVRAKDLVATHGAEVIRYLLLSTHYRSPIEFSEEALSNSKKALSVFQRLFERIERISGKRVTEKSPEMDAVAGALIEGQQYAAFAKTVLGRRMQFLERIGIRGRRGPDDEPVTHAGTTMPCPPRRRSPAAARLPSSSRSTADAPPK
jgi:cysteinyl-tRNA synthetase